MARSTCKWFLIAMRTCRPTVALDTLSAHGFRRSLDAQGLQVAARDLVVWIDVEGAPEVGDAFVALTGEDVAKSPVAISAGMPGVELDAGREVAYAKLDPLQANVNA